MTTKKEEQRLDSNRRILEAALIEFAENGYKAARLGDIAARAGVTAGLITQRFRTKQDLFAKVFNGELAKYAGSITDFTDLQSCMLDHVHRIKDLAEKNDPTFTFVTMSLQNPNGLPEDCRQHASDLFVGSKVSKLMAEEYPNAEEESGVEPRAMFLLFLRCAAGITYAFNRAGIPLPPDDAYLSLIDGALKHRA